VEVNCPERAPELAADGFNYILPDERKTVYSPMGHICSFPTVVNMILALDFSAVGAHLLSIAVTRRPTAPFGRRRALAR
jgi:hypothetical protein